AYIFAKNNVVLSAAQLEGANKLVTLSGDHRGNVFAGACFDPPGRYLFVNIQTPGITFAITGPWAKGPL
uniref:alkaline phosphatase PhoX n=1 Tax=Achromobacter sp. GbtcB20 TaxID=2824765 RepID=UPI001C303649